MGWGRGGPGFSRSWVFQVLGFPGPLGHFGPNLVIFGQKMVYVKANFGQISFGQKPRLTRAKNLRFLAKIEFDFDRKIGQNRKLATVTVFVKWSF